MAKGSVPFRNQKTFGMFVNLQNIRKIKLKNRVRAPFLKILDPSLNLAALTTDYNIA